MTNHTGRRGGVTLTGDELGNVSADGSPIPEAAESYNEDDFHVPISAGTDDLSVTQSFRCTSKTDRQIEIILSAKKFPYITKGDLLRHALHRHLDYLTRLQPSMPSIMPAIEAIREITRQEADMAKFGGTLDEIQGTINRLLGHGRIDQARALVNQIYYKAKKIADENWRDHYLTTIYKDYGFLLLGDNVKLLTTGETPMSSEVQEPVVLSQKIETALASFAEVEEG